MQLEPYFFSLCLALYLLIRWYLRVWLELNLARLISFFFSIWLVITAMLARTGFLADHALSTPPGILVILAPMVVFWIWTARSTKVMELTLKFSVAGIAGLQFFRVFVEFAIFQLAAVDLMPEVMTWNGRNFDVLIGLSAPVVAWLLKAGGERNRKIAVVWNWAGLMMLANVVGHGILTAPSMFRVDSLGGENRAILMYPYVWIPSFFVLIAVTSHIWMLRRLAKPVSQG